MVKKRGNVFNDELMCRLLSRQRRIKESTPSWSPTQKTPINAHWTWVAKVCLFLGLVNVSSAQFDSFCFNWSLEKYSAINLCFCLHQSKAGPQPRWNGHFSPAKKIFKKTRKEKKDLVVFNWIHRVDFFSCGRKKCVTHPKEKPQSTHPTSQLALNIAALFSCGNIPPPDKAVPESGIFTFPPLHVCVTNLSKSWARQLLIMGD